MNIGDIFGVNGKVNSHHFFVYLGNDRFFDTIANEVYSIPVEEAEMAQGVKTFGNSYVLEFIQNLPKDVFEVVDANTKDRESKPLTLLVSNG